MKENITKNGVIIYLPRYIGECSIKMPVLYINKDEQYDLTGNDYEYFEQYDNKRVTVVGDIYENEGVMFTKEITM